MKTATRPRNLGIEVKDNTVVIETPDLDNLDPWLDRYLTKPLAGFADARSKETGKRLRTKREQLMKSRQWLKDMVPGNRKFGTPDEKTQADLMEMVSPESPYLDPQPTSKHK